MATTLANLRTRVRYNIKDTDATTWTNAEVDQRINDAERKLWAKLAKDDPSFGLREATFSFAQADENIAYPTDILGRQIHALYVYAASTDPKIEVKRGSLQQVMGEGTTQTEHPWFWTPLDGYYKIGPPKDATTYTGQVFYTRKPTAMTDAANNMDSPDELAEAIAIEAAIECFVPRGLDVKFLQLAFEREWVAAVQAMTVEGLLTAEVLDNYKEEFSG